MNSRRHDAGRDYHINIFYSKDDGGYIADIPDLTYGNTPDEALEDVLVAKDAWLSAARKNKKAIPPPRYRPVLYQLKRAAGSR